jgi:hypothetical protein
MRGFLFIFVALTLMADSVASTCEMIDDPAGYRYLECDPAKAKAAKEANRAALETKALKPEQKAGHQMSVEEWAAHMAVKNATNEKERAAAEARLEAFLRGSEKERAAAESRLEAVRRENERENEKERAAAAARVEAVRREEDKKQAEIRRRQASAAERAEAEFRQAAETGSLGSWRYALKEDRMGGGQTKTAITLSKNEISFGFPYQGSQKATLSLRAHPRYGRDVILSVPKGQFICGVSGCSVTVRFGNGKPQRYSVSPPDDHSSNVLFIEGHDRFVANARKVDKLLIEAAFYQEGNRVFEFEVTDLKWPFGRQ